MKINKNVIYFFEFIKCFIYKIKMILLFRELYYVKLLNIFFLLFKIFKECIIFYV